MELTNPTKQKNELIGGMLYFSCIPYWNSQLWELPINIPDYGTVDSIFVEKRSNESNNIDFKKIRKLDKKMSNPLELVLSQIADLNPIYLFKKKVYTEFFTLHDKLCSSYPCIFLIDSEKARGIIELDIQIDFLNKMEVYKDFYSSNVHHKTIVGLQEHFNFNYEWTEDIFAENKEYCDWLTERYQDQIRDKVNNGHSPFKNFKDREGQIYGLDLMLGVWYTNSSNEDFIESDHVNLFLNNMKSTLERGNNGHKSKCKIIRELRV